MVHHINKDGWARVIERLRVFTHSHTMNHAHMRTLKRQTKDYIMNADRVFGNINKGIGIAMIGIVPLSLSLPPLLSPPPSDTTPSTLSPSLSDEIDPYGPDVDPLSLPVTTDTSTIYYYDHLPACDDEDGTLPPNASSCVWDATVRSNGQGESFIVISR